MADSVAELIDRVVSRSSGEEVFHQAVHEVLESVVPILARYPELQDSGILERMVEPERVIMLRVPWLDRENRVRVNRGYRIEMNSAIGPYKGGLRFHPAVSLSVLKFLAFDQVFKRSRLCPWLVARGAPILTPRTRPMSMSWLSASPS